MLGDILLTTGAITPPQLKSALKYSKSKNIFLGNALIQKKLITNDMLQSALAKSQNIHLLQLMQSQIEPSEAIDLLMHLSTTATNLYKTGKITAEQLIIATNHIENLQDEEQILQTMGLYANHNKTTPPKIT